MSQFLGQPQVIVGVDGSAESRRALLWAATAAHRRGLPLRIVHTWLWPAYHVPLGPAPGGPPSSGLRAAAERVLEDARKEATALAPDAEVSTSLVFGDASVVFVDLSPGAEMIVLGCRGLGGFGGLMLGSVGLHVSSRARCPVVVVRGDGERGGRVLVGVDGSESSTSALERAFEVAASLRTGLLAVTTWDVAPGLRDTPADAHQSSLEDGARSTLLKVVEPWRHKFEQVPLEARVVEGSPAATLVELSRQAPLVVVGTHGAGSLRGLVLGSVSHALLHHAHCPVMVVPRERRG